MGVLRFDLLELALTLHLLVLPMRQTLHLWLRSLRYLNVFPQSSHFMEFTPHAEARWRGIWPGEYSPTHLCTTLYKHWILNSAFWRLSSSPWAFFQWRYASCKMCSFCGQLSQPHIYTDPSIGLCSMRSFLWRIRTVGVLTKACAKLWWS